MDKNILIASCTLDEATYGPVVSQLNKHGYEVVVFEADKVAEGTIPFSVKVDSDLGTTIQYNESQLALDSLGAAWYRRAEHFYGTSDTKNLTIDAERTALQSGVWNLIPDNTWLNTPKLMPAANKKLVQLDVAVIVGFQIPKTVITNQWRPIHEELPEDIIYKSSNPLFYDDEKVLTMFTTPFQNAHGKLPVNRNPFPGIWQEQLSKSREWRITAVGDETFDVAIYTSDQAKDDWRKHQLDPKMVEFRHEVFPNNLREKCIKYLGEFGLRFGAFDFIEDEDGKITFLECNPNGQYMWLEEALDLPIACAITDELIKIAKEHSC